MPVKLSDVAERAGVSTASVSRVLAKKPHVSETVRKRVLAAVNELSFVQVVWRAVCARSVLW